ncbi:DUF4166 domain-containing protein [Mesorhizobium sp. M1329]|uniref:DUF4166 domain-containing protein n=1 Tax=Mesorhizobium sp. M1329 TaxID=2957083 RepID=UPI003335CEAB
MARDATADRGLHRPAHQLSRSSRRLRFRRRCLCVRRGCAKRRRLRAVRRLELSGADGGGGAPPVFGPDAGRRHSRRHRAFRFHVEISHPLAGMIARYRGWLEPSGPHGSSEIVSPASLASSRQSCTVHSVQP